MTIVHHSLLSLFFKSKVWTSSRTLLVALLLLLFLFTQETSITSTTRMVYAAASSPRVPVLEYDDGQIRVLNCLLGASSRESCDIRSYHKIMWLWATPTLCIAAITFVFLTIYFPSKYCCNCCGGRYQRPNICWPDYQLPAKYSKGELFRPVFLSVACCLMCIAGCVWAYTSASRVERVWNEIMQHSDHVVEHMHRALYDILLPSFQMVAHFNTLPSTTTTTNNKSHELQLYDIHGNNKLLEDTLAQIMEMIENVRSSSIVVLHNFVSQYIVAIYLISIITVLISVFGMVAGVCGWRRYTSMAVMSLLCVLSVLAWLLTAHSVVSYFVVNGACSEVFAFNQQRVNVLHAAMNCNESELQLLSTTLDEIAETYITYSNIYSHNNSNNHDNGLISLLTTFTASTLRTESLQQGNNNDSSSYEISRHAMPNEENDGNLSHHHHKERGESSVDKLHDSAEEHVDQTEFHSNEDCRYSTCNTSICNSNCPNKCSNTVTESMLTAQHHEHQVHNIAKYKKAVNDAVKLFNAVHQLQHVMTTVKSRLTRCEPIVNEFVSPLNDKCQQVMYNSYNLYQGLGLLALATTVGLFAYVYGAKRFIPFDQAYLPQNDLILIE